MVSRLDQDTATALANIREWRNSFAPINRLPLEVLSLIPTLLSSENDVSRACSVCRHWHRTFVQQAVLWSNLNLTIKLSNLFIKTRLERAKGFPLNITSSHQDRADVLALLAPHAQQLQNLKFVFDCWSYVRKFSEATSGPLPLLHTLIIHVFDDVPFFSEGTIPPSAPLFSGAINLKHFSLITEVLPFLDCFAFPNLTTFDLSATSHEEPFPASQLLDFLEATPTLRDIRLVIQEEISLAGVLPGRIVVLPNVETFTATEESPGYKIAAHISCPNVRCTSLIHEHHPADTAVQEAFLNSSTWNEIPPQYMIQQIHEVVLESITTECLMCYLSFLSPGSAALKLGYRIIDVDEDEEDEDESRLRPMLGREYVAVFSQACQAIRNHPQLANVKRMRIQDWRAPVSSSQLKRVVMEVGQLFKSMGPLEELTLDASDLRPYFAPFIDDHPDFDDAKRSYTYPQIKVLTIATGLRGPLEADSEAAIVEFTKFQHTKGVPLELVVFQMVEPPAGTVERLQQWVGAVNYDQENL